MHLSLLLIYLFRGVQFIVAPSNSEQVLPGDQMLAARSRGGRTGRRLANVGLYYIRLVRIAVLGLWHDNLVIAGPEQLFPRD
jgi:hypothetical protein